MIPRSPPTCSARLSSQPTALHASGHCSAAGARGVREGGGCWSTRVADIKARVRGGDLHALDALLQACQHRIPCQCCALHCARIADGAYQAGTLAAPFRASPLLPLPAPILRQLLLSRRGSPQCRAKQTDGGLTAKRLTMDPSGKYSANWILSTSPSLVAWPEPSE
eukprot:139339-Rhodomonas_salina.1